MKKSILHAKWGQSSFSNRFDQLRSYFENKEVLDIGCVVGYNKDIWMHSQINNVAKKVVGIDIQKDKIEILRNRGFDVHFEDAQDFDLKQKFDLVHAGELIEHLDNFSGFLSSVRKHLKPAGKLLITTPNALRLSNFIYSISGGLRLNREHTCWFCETTLSQLLERNGYKIEKIGYLKHESYSIPRKIFSKLRGLLLSEQTAWNTLYVVASLKEHPND